MTQRQKSGIKHRDLLKGISIVIFDPGLVENNIELLFLLFIYFGETNDFFLLTMAFFYQNRWARMVAFPMSSTPGLLNWIVLDMGWLLTLRPLSPRREQVTLAYSKKRQDWSWEDKELSKIILQSMTRFARLENFNEILRLIIMFAFTGVQIEQSAYISVSRVVGSVLFENMDEDYRRGIPYCGQVNWETETV